MKNFVLLLGLCILVRTSAAQSTNDLLNLLIDNKIITTAQADSVRADAANKQRKADATSKSFVVNAARQMQLSSFTQIRYMNQDESGKIDGFDIRRARLDLKGNITPNWGYRVQTELATSPKLLDAYAEFKLRDYFNMIIGQAKVPFSLENLTSSGKLECIDRSQVVEALVSRGKDVIGNQNGRDIGVQVYGNFWKAGERKLVDYRIGIFNESGINVIDRNETKGFIGRMLLHPLKGLDVGGSYLNGMGYTGVPAADQARKRYGFELAYEWKRLNVKAEFIEGQDGDITRNGWYAQAAYFIVPEHLQAIVKYDTFDPNSANADDESTIYTVILNYNFSAFIRLQAAYAFREEAFNIANNNTGAVQLQIGF